MVAMLLLAAVLLPTPVADYAGALLAGHPSLGPTLHRIALRESRGQWVSVHEQDARWSSLARRKALARGLLDQSCGFHVQRGGWATRGRHGMFAAFSLHHIGGCWPAWVLDVPVVSAFVAAKRASSKRCDQHPRCVSWRSGQ